MDLDGLMNELDARLAAADAALVADYPGDRASRQPLHTVYVPADRFDTGTVADWADEARDTLGRHAGSALRLAEALELRPSVADEVYDRVRGKLDTEPIEDLRIDFEDGYGDRPDDEEDAAAEAAAGALSRMVQAGTAPPFHGVRIRSLGQATRRRGLRTLALVVDTLVSRESLTDGFLVTVPKVTSVDQVEAIALALESIEGAHRLTPRSLRFEIQVETPQAILGSDGTVLVARMIRASGGRCAGLHYGTYDYSAACGIAGAYQSMEHPAADHAKAVMQVAAAGTGVFVSDGSTNVLPVGDTDSVHAAWRLHVRLVRRSLARGFYQGWDLHPAQLPSRFVATYSFYREGLAEAATRLGAYVHAGSSAFLDEPATAGALAGFLQRGLDCGAVDASELDKLAGLGPWQVAELAGRRQP